MARLILIALVLLLPVAASAALPWEPRFTWAMPDSEAPEQYTYRLYCTSDGSQPTTGLTPVVEAPWAPNGDGTSSWMASRGTFRSGDWTCALTTVDGEAESALSNTVSFSVPLPAPTNLIVE